MQRTECPKTAQGWTSRLRGTSSGTGPRRTWPRRQRSGHARHHRVQANTDFARVELRIYVGLCSVTQMLKRKSVRSRGCSDAPRVARVTCAAARRCARTDRSGPARCGLRRAAARATRGGRVDRHRAPTRDRDKTRTTRGRRPRRDVRATAPNRLHVCSLLTRTCDRAPPESVYRSICEQEDPPPEARGVSSLSRKYVCVYVCAGCMLGCMWVRSALQSPITGVESRLACAL